MAKRLQHRGGTTSQHSTFTGAVREVTVDTDKNTLVVHDGATAGGHPLATATNFTSTGIDDNATSTAITIDSSENVGIGTSSPSRLLSLNAVSPSMDFSNGTWLNEFINSAGQMEFRADHTNASASSVITFSVDGSEAMRIRSDGNVLIGKTSLDYESTTGHILRGDGLINSTRSNGNVTDFNRLSSDGEVLRISKDGTTVGSIGSHNGDKIFIGSFGGTNPAGLKFQTQSAPYISPCTSTGTQSDNVQSLGTSGARFKDLYLGGGLYVGGTGTANKLDEYEEGSWTVNVSDASGNTVTGVGNGTFTKIGNLCLLQFALSATLTSLTSGDVLRITNIPFGGASGLANRHSTSGLRHFDNVSLTSGYTFVNLVQNQNTGYLVFREFGSGVASKDVTVGQFGSSTGTMQGSIIYRTA